MELKELIKRIEHDELHPVVSDSALGFYCQPSDHGRIPEPRPAAKYIADGMKNYPYKRSASASETPSRDTPAVTQALETGWILPMPVDLLIHPDENGRPVPIAGKMYREYARDYWQEIQTAGSGCVLQVDTGWVIDVPDGYSVLYTTPANFTSNDLAVIPGIVDGGEFPMKLTVPVIPLQQHTRIDSGTPLIHVYPFKQTDFSVTARIGTLPLEDETDE